MHKRPLVCKNASLTARHTGRFPDPVEQHAMTHTAEKPPTPPSSSLKKRFKLRKPDPHFGRDPSRYKIEAATGQHIGGRKEQQDRVALLAAPRAPGYVMAILADGMGGISGGSMAAEQVIHCAKLLFDEFSPLTHNVPSMLNTLLMEAHTLVKLTGISARTNPHSTLVMLVLTPEKKAIWAYAGDSRLYRFRGPNCAEHTVDHSLVQQMIAEGKISQEELQRHPLSNVLTNGIGGSTSPYLTFGEYDGLRPGDSFMLCSDGLWAYFSKEELAAMVGVNTPRQASVNLINKANERANGQGDNCSVAIVKLVEAD